MATNRYIIQLIVETGSGEAKVKGVSKALQDLDASSKRAKKSVDENGKAIKGMGASAGVAGAATAELGRLISDMPYGIQGVTNNISQLGSMFALLVGTTGGVTKALGAMIGTMLGPAGILIAFQSVVAGIDFFSRKTKEAKEQAQEFSNALILQKGILDAIRGSFTNGNKSVEERIRLLKTLALTDENLQNILKNGKLTDEERIQQAERYIDNVKAVEQAEKDLLEAKKIIDEDGRTLDEIQEELTKKRAERLFFQQLEASNQATAAIRLGAKVDIAIRDAQIRKLEELERKYQFVEDQLTATSELRESISVEAVKKEKEEIKALAGSIQAVKDKISKLEEQRDKTAKTALEIRRYNEEISQLEEVLKRLESGGLIQKVTNNLKTQGEVVGKALVEGTMTDAQKLADKELNKIGKSAVDAFQESVKQNASSKEITDDEWFLETFGFTKDRFAKTAGMVQQGLNAATDLIDAQLQRDIDLEKNKTNAINDQLRERLRNEQLTATERDKINQEIAKNEAALVEKQNEIEEKRFKLNKAQGVANAVINTAVGVSKVLPNIPLAAFIGALGAAQIATIASQKFVPQPSPTPNLSAQGGPSESQGPAFNLIGAGGQSQLAQAIASQQRAPIKTYVVAGEVTTAQSMERNRVKEASI